MSSTYKHICIYIIGNDSDQVPVLGRDMYSQGKEKEKEKGKATVTELQFDAYYYGRYLYLSPGRPRGPFVIVLETLHQPIKSPAPNTSGAPFLKGVLAQEVQQLGASAYATEFIFPNRGTRHVGSSYHPSLADRTYPTRRT